MGIENNENSSKTILIVEDESIIALNLKYDLEDLGQDMLLLLDHRDFIDAFSDVQIGQMDKFHTCAPFVRGTILLHHK